MTDENAGPGPSRDEAYAAWFDRMRNKKAPTPEPQATAPSAAGTGSYWSPENLFRDAELEREQARERERAAKARRDEIEGLLARLGLAPDATWATVTTAYKRLAKEHHPDAHAGTGAADHHLEQMMEVNRVYNTLRGLMAR